MRICNNAEPTNAQSVLHYLFYKDFAVLDIYRQFIDGWFATHAGAVVLPIAAGLLIIAGGMFLGGRLITLAIVGVVSSGLAIAPLGIGSAFPCTILLAFAAIHLWVKQHGNLCCSKNG